MIQSLGVGGQTQQIGGNTQTQYDTERDNLLKRRLQDAMHQYNIKQVEVARETGIHHSSLSLWLQGKIKGHQVKIPDTLEQYLESLMSTKPRMNSVYMSKLSQLKSPNNKIEEGDLEPPENDFGTLIPIKLDIEIEGARLRENFLWDKNEAYISLELFAKLLIEENNLNQAFEADIVSQMKKQIKDFRGYKVMSTQIPLQNGQQQQINLEQIRIIKLNVRVGRIVYRDQFEWDINNPQNSPEQFAECLCADMGLGPEFLLPITFQIREKVLELQKVAYSERRQKQVGGALATSELSFYGKSDGSYAQTRQGQSYNQMPLNTQHIGLPITQFRTENNQPITVQGIQNNSDVVMRDASHSKTMIRSLETVQDQSNARQRKQVNYFNTAPLEDEFSGWAPEIQIIDDNELKKIEKQEERESRYRKRRTR